MMFRGDLYQGQASPGSESLEVNLFDETQIPWQELAFPVIRETLTLYFADRATGQFNVHTGDIIREQDDIVVRHY